jgi:regulator of protease activity HflC (stomatin/prohibitin superfamily)
LQQIYPDFRFSDLAHKLKLVMPQCFCLGCVDSADKGVIQDCGKFNGIAEPGFIWLNWPVQTVSAVSLRTQQVEVHTNTKTKDNVTVKVTCAIQYQVDPNQIETFYFKLYNPTQQIEAYVDDCVRSQLPTMTLDEAFVSTEQVAGHVKEVVSANLKQFGLIVVKALMTDMQPDATVMAAMNKINASRREREAAVETAEAAKILAVRAAEAEAEAKHLSGMGTAKMRSAITSGFQTSIGACVRTRVCLCV